MRHHKIDKRVLVLGAGMVGTCTALELQARGADVTLIDRKEPGLETSYGNAGVVTRSSLIPMNNPGLWKNLPKLLSNRTASLRYNIPFLMRNMGWALGFMARARKGPYLQTAAALDALISYSSPIHRHLLSEAGSDGHLNDLGWIFLYRNQAGFNGSKISRDTFDHFDVATEILDRGGIAQMEPKLNPIFSNAIWIKDTFSVDSPGKVVESYAKLFVQRGGLIERRDVAGLESLDGIWRVSDTSGHVLEAENVCVCLGPWARDFLEKFGMRVPMGFERGYHMHYSGGMTEAGNSLLSRPIYDTGGGYVLSPMEQGLRLTTGVELTACEAPHNHAQLKMAENSAREAIDLGDRLEDQPWLGRRPTMPDSRPVIGPAPNRKGLYFAFGHQHVGFSTGPGTGRIIADLMAGDAPEIDANPFSPARFFN